MTPQEFFDCFGAAAQAICREHGLPASVCLSQMAQESGWAKKMPPGSNNPFGLKYRESEGGDYVWHWTPEYLPNQTWEDIPEQYRSFWQEAADIGPGWWLEYCRFKKFSRPEEAIVAYCRRIINSGYYQSAIDLLPDTEAYCRELCRIYATRSTYPDEVWNRILKYDLLQYDAA